MFPCGESPAHWATEELTKESIHSPPHTPTMYTEQETVVTNFMTAILIMTICGR